LGQGLLTSTFVGEIMFAIVVATLGLVLFALLIGNMQVSVYQLSLLAYCCFNLHISAINFSSNVFIMTKQCLNIGPQSASYHPNSLLITWRVYDQFVLQTFCSEFSFFFMLQTSFSSIVLYQLVLQEAKLV